MDARERHDLIGEQGPYFETGRVDEPVEPRCRLCDRVLDANGSCAVHGPPCNHLSTYVRREPPSWAPTPWPAALIEECEDCGEVISSSMDTRPKESSRA